MGLCLQQSRSELVEMNCFNCYIAATMNAHNHHEQEGKADSKVSIVEDISPNGSTNISTSVEQECNPGYGAWSGGSKYE